MRYSKAHKEETRRKLLDSSRALVKKGGFDTTGVEALMSAIGMTPGAFYSHFPSKQALLEAVIQEELEHSIGMFRPGPQNDLETFRKRLKVYLSASHVRHPEAGCVLPALGAELGRGAPQVRGMVEEGLNRMHANWKEALGDEDAAWAALSQCVGALVLARSVKSEAARTRILEANRAHIERLLDAARKPA